MNVNLLRPGGLFENRWERVPATACTSGAGEASVTQLPAPPASRPAALFTKALEGTSCLHDPALPPQARDKLA
jgi:hypothetical protein